MECNGIVEYRIDESRIATVISADFGMASDIDACLLSRTERILASQIPSETRRLQFIFGRVFLRSAVGHICDTEPYRGEFVMGRFGKPYLPASYSPLFFNLSHTRQKIAVAFVKGEAIGIDIERAGREISPHLQEFVFRPEEIHCISLDEDEKSAFLHGWVCKEAVLKCIGSGLSRDPKTIGLDLNNSRQPSFKACDYSSIRSSGREFRLVRLTHLQNTIGVIALRERPLRDGATHRILKKGE
jgi:4'-phosphopantetheinyl transferase